jgi:hypothetical protein
MFCLRRARMRVYLICREPIGAESFLSAFEHDADR